MKKIILVSLLFFTASSYGQKQNATKAVFDCTEIMFWMKQLDNGFKDCKNVQVVDDYEISTDRKVNGFNECGYRRPKELAYFYVGGTNTFKTFKEAATFYNKIKKQTSTCLASKKYDIYPEEKDAKEESQFQVANKKYGTNGGYYQTRVEVKKHYTIVNDADKLDGYEVSFILELRKKGVAG